ncbi:hypothetical protein HKX48_005012 [Thoreauomyces humboldtii]|nr:hypothetical protein HKX48_005012 [Thoreauomyces humboldtii]
MSFRATRTPFRSLLTHRSPFPIPRSPVSLASRSVATLPPPPASGRAAVASRLHYFTALAAAFSSGCIVTWKLASDAQAADAFTEISDESELAHSQFLTAERDSLKLVEELRKDPDMKEVDPYSYLSGGALHRNFSAGAMKGKGKLALRPVLFHNADHTECVVVLHLGERLSGHDRIVHGGVLATLLDEMCARATILSLPNRIGFTANLNIDYRRPVAVDQFVVLRSRLTSLEGRKAYAKARIESVDGDTVYVEATALFVSPKNPLVGLAAKWRAS